MQPMMHSIDKVVQAHYYVRLLIFIISQADLT